MVLAEEQTYDIEDVGCKKKTEYKWLRYLAQWKRSKSTNRIWVVWVLYYIL